MEQTRTLIQKLHETLGKMEAALGSIREGIVWTDINGSIQWCNTAFDDLFSIPHITILGKPLFELMPLEIDNQPLKIREHPIGVLMNTVSCDARIYEFWRAGKLVHLEISGSRASIVEPGEMYILSIRDVTELTESQNALKNAKDTLEKRVSERTVMLHEIMNQYKSILAAAVDAIITIDEKGRIRSFNPSAENIFGYAEQDVIGRNVNIIIPSPLKEKHNGYIKKYLETCHKKIIGIGREVTGINKDGKTIELYLAVSEVRIKNQVLFTGILRDISLQKKAEKDLKQAKKEAESANQAKSAFLANMSHEIRTPLNAVLGFSELLSSMVTGSRQKSYLDSIQTSGKGLLTIINDILDLSKIEAGKLTLNYESINLRKLLKEIQQIFMPAIRKKEVVLRVWVVPGFPTGLLLDEIRLRQVLINLVGNALKFTHKGHVTIKAELKKTGKPHIEDLEIIVSDTGIGIPESHQAEIFKAFQQQEIHTAKLYGGTGLGLAITERLVKMMNGKIRLVSQEGRGSDFIVRLPDIEIVGENGKTAPESSGMDAAEVCFEPASILVVDDVVSNRELIKAILLETRIDVVEADSGKAALDSVRNSVPDLVLMDIRMPEMDGVEVLNRLKQDSKIDQIPVIAMTASLNFESTPKTDLTDFDGVLYKPVSVSEFMCELCRFLPYKVIKKAGDADNDFQIPDDGYKGIRDLPVLIRSLETKGLVEWEKFTGVLEMEALSVFAGYLKKIGTIHNALPLITYADRIIRAVDNFEVDFLDDLMGRFPELIESFKNNGV